MRFVAGLDGGGTKTAVAIANEAGQVVHRFAVGAMNVNGQDETDVRNSFHEIFEVIASVCGTLDACAHVCIGAAGVSNPDARSALLQNVRSAGYVGAVTIAGDHETALYGAHEQGQGILLIAGTGSICYGRNADGGTHRTGGFGHLIDDGGSGYSIGRDLLEAVIKAGDGRSGETVITELVYAKLKIASIGELVRFVYDKQRNKQDIAALSPLLSVACDDGDSAAQHIVRRNAAMLLELVEPVAEKLGLTDGELAWAGGVLQHNEHIRKGFIELLSRRYPGMRCFPARSDAAYGAVLMAMESCIERGGDSE